MTQFTPATVNGGLTCRLRRAVPLWLRPAARFGLLVAAGLSLSGCFGAFVAATATTGVLVAQDRSIGSAIDDTGTDLDIQSQLADDSFDAYRRVHVEVYEGRVLLTGTVKTPEERQKAARIAWSRPNVKEVINEIEVTDKSPVKRWPKDTWISTRLKTKMMWDRKVKSLNYQVDVVNGTVYLSGVAHSPEELERLTDIARNMKGVKRVVSHVRVKAVDPQTTPQTPQDLQNTAGQQPADPVPSTPQRQAVALEDRLLRD